MLAKNSPPANTRRLPQTPAHAEWRPLAIRRLHVVGAALILATAVALLGPDSGLRPQRARAASLSQLGSELNAKQSELNANQTEQQQLSSKLAVLQHEIQTLSSQISLVQSRESEVEAALRYDRAKLQSARAALERERARAAMLRRELLRARHILAVELVARYEQPQPSLVSVVLEANGFNQLLEQLQYLRSAENQVQSAITLTRRAKSRAEAATVRLGHLAATDRQLAAATEVQARALEGMNQLLQSRQSALTDVRSAQQSALGAAQARGTQLRAAIASVQAQQQAAERAAAAAAAARAAAEAQSASPSAVSATPGGGWAIPNSVVSCESGGQNLPPNSAGASGYYQILPSTWRLFGGSGRAAYLASKTQQDAVASRIWNGGAGASDWVCSGIVGIG
ncbi:MAG TPA: transglycosylase family protein [Solirubrobacteraceae bacterium]